MGDAPHQGDDSTSGWCLNIRWFLRSGWWLNISTAPSTVSINKWCNLSHRWEIGTTNSRGWGCKGDDSHQGMPQHLDCSINSRHKQMMQSLTQMGDWHYTNSVSAAEGAKVMTHIKVISQIKVMTHINLWVVVCSCLPSWATVFWVMRLYTSISGWCASYIVKSAWCGSITSRWRWWLTSISGWCASIHQLLGDAPLYINFWVMRIYTSTSGWCASNINFWVMRLYTSRWW